MAIIHIDGQDVEVDGADNLLQACLSLGIDIPYFCYHPALGSVGSCRQCAVKQYNNKEDYESADALATKGGREIYELSGKENVTHLSVLGDLPEELFNTMSNAWDKALNKLKTTAENIKN